MKKDMDTLIRRIAAFAFAFLFLAAVNVSPAGPFGYAIDTTRSLYEIDLGAAEATLIGPTGIAALVEGLASDANGNLYATTPDGNLYRLDRATGAATLLGNHGAGDFEGLDFRNGTLLGIGYTSRPQQIYAIDPGTPVATSQTTLDRSDILSISSLATAGEHTAFFQGVLTIGIGTLFTVDPDTGQTNLIGDLDTPVAALDYDGAALFGLGFSGKVFFINPATAAMELIGTTAGEQAWLALDIPRTAVSILECAATGTGGDSTSLRGIRFHTDRDFNGIALRMEATFPGDYYFDVQLRRSDGFAVLAERIVSAAAIGLSGDFATTPYQPVNIDFGAVSVAGPESFTVKITNVSGPGGALLFETFGSFVEPCPGVEEMDILAPTPTVVGDPAGFKLLTDPRARVPLLVCETPGTIIGDLADFRGVRFTTVRDFRSAELRFNGSVAGRHGFDVELRRSTGFTAIPERIVTGLSVDVPGFPSTQPYRAATIDFSDLVRVLGEETFTLKMTNASPAGLLFQTYGIGNMPCPNVDETDSNNVPTPVVRGDPAGYRLLSDRDLPIPTLWCDTPGLVGFNVVFRGIRFTTSDPFSAFEVRMDSDTAGIYSFGVELRRSTGFLVPPERFVPDNVVAVPGNPLVNPYTSVARIDFGTEPVAPGTFTLRFVDIAGPSSNLFLDVDGGACPSGDVVATLENNVADPTPTGSPAGFRLLLQPDSDGDGVNDFVDNCLFQPNPGQQDIDSDGIGSACDGDFDNNCNVDFVDLAAMRENFFAVGEYATDMNSDGRTNFIDLDLFRAAIFLPPGPAAAPNLCP